MKHISIPTGLLCLAAFTANLARADDSDVDVVGPNGRTSMAAFVSRYAYRSDQIIRASGQYGGDLTHDSSMLAVSGVYAINDRVSLTGSLPVTISDEVANTWLSTTKITQRSGAGASVGLSAVLLGQQAANGFALVGSLATGKTAGYPAQRALTLQPQYRVDDKLLLSASIGAHNQADYPNTQVLALNLIWRATPNVTLIPSLAVSQYAALNTFSAYSDVGFGLSATYHVDKDWSASASIALRRIGDTSTSVYANNVSNAHSSNLVMGVRRNF